ncbi:alcohol dehydrogenase catalytic domain-containing protein [Sinorhizobium medicae]|uniref:alcohol dehydrogenase catalytic domain-containing protein n=1 Tax=Sinorhizobium medicae TaxID=110321 RepID=UPI00308620B3|nr:alcohol dehydrogenase catalytic domain-containing protein [Sinorhizobium medicae]
MVSCGICHTDTLPRDQVVPAPFPAVYGHEGAGVVEKVGAKVTKLQPGDHVVNELPPLRCLRHLQDRPADVLS